MRREFLCWVAKVRNFVMELVWRVASGFEASWRRFL